MRKSSADVSCRAVPFCVPTGAALKIFEGLEMWDQLIVCYRLLDKKQVAQELVMARLQVGGTGGHTYLTSPWV
jgi:hypothetical protein